MSEPVSEVGFAGSVPAIYDRHLVPMIFDVYASDLAARVAATGASSVLEIAAGTGAVTRRLAADLPAAVSLVATDLSPAMIEHARSVGTSRPVEWQVADAMALPFPDDGFDAAVCQFGAMFFPDRVQAYREVARVVRPGGTFVFNVWDRMEHNDFAHVLWNAVAALYPDDPPHFLPNIPHGYHDGEQIRADLAAAGFGTAVQIDAVEAVSRAADHEVVAMAYCQGTPMWNFLVAHGEGHVERATEVASAAVAEAFGTQDLEGRISAFVVTATHTRGRVMSRDVDALRDAVDAIAADVGLSGVVRVDVDGITVERAYGLAHRALAVPNDVDTRFAVASGSKMFTALVVMALVDDGLLALDAPARSWLGDDLPLVDDRVTIEHLLSHRSGIGDYLDESTVTDWNDHVLSVPVHELCTTEAFLAVLDGRPTKFPPGERFDYSNSGFVVLALAAERVSGTPFHDLVEQRVCRPAGMLRTAYLRSDELPGDAALGYLHDEGPRCNVLHLPVRGNGDGGAYTTAADMAAFWQACFAGRIVSTRSLEAMTQPRSLLASNGLHHGMGCWLDPHSGAVSVHGFDPGVGFVSSYQPRSGQGVTVCCNQSRGAWPMAQRLDQLLAVG